MKVSVVIPVYNTRPYLAECLDSALTQDLPGEEFEVVAVDDGSSDGSAELLDHYCAMHSNMRVIHQENSGWPGKPRNVGRTASRGEYIFFADSDDILAPQALRRMYDFAVANGSDVVVPKIVTLNGPSPAGPVWRQTQVDGDLPRLIYTIGPWKLFRKRFLDERGIWFPEEKMRLEDGVFVTEAYVTARRVSILADYEYYRKRTQPDRGNISSSPVDPDGYTDSIGRMIGIIREHCADGKVADATIAALYQRKALKWFLPDRFPGYPPEQQEAWVRAVRNLQDPHVPPRVEALLPLAHRMRSVLVRHGEVAALANVCTAQQAGRPLDAVLVGTALELHVPGLAAQSPLQVMRDLRLIPAVDTMATPPPPALLPGAVASLARRLLWPLARRTARGRQVWTRARDQYLNRRRG